jgi:hypothetical protein
MANESHTEGVGNSTAPVSTKYDYFKGSHVRDRQGMLKTVFHGTPDARFVKDKGVFQTLEEQYGKVEDDPKRVFFFTDSQPMASSYADDTRAWDYQNAEPAVIPVHLNLQNPKVLNWEGKEWKGTREAIEQAKAEGHDGVIINNVIDYYSTPTRKVKPGTVYAAFHPHQIKHTSNEAPTADKSMYKSEQSLPDHLAQAVASIRSPGVLTPDLRDKNFESDNKYAGYSYIAAEALAHLINAEQTGWSLNRVGHDGHRHFFLKHLATGAILDPTFDDAEQPPKYKTGIEMQPLTGWGRISKLAQVVIDRVKGLQESLAGDPDVPADQEEVEIDIPEATIFQNATQRTR